MKISRRKLELVMARQKKGRLDVRAAGIGCQTWKNAQNGANMLPRTVGRIADALGVDVLEIIADE
jgi:hypothetical protein